MSWNGHPVIDLDSHIVERADRFYGDYMDPAYRDAYQQLCDAVTRQAEAGNGYSLFGSRTSIVEPIEAGRPLGRRDTFELKELLYANAESPIWDAVAERCLSCTNCTAVCPTCFCTSVEDVTDLSGDVAGRERVWDSCFNADFSYIHGGTVRGSTRSRYRQWMTHKLGSWIDQFGMSGCVGCGRCITWCPAAIDITEEAAALRAAAVASPSGEG